MKNSVKHSTLHHFADDTNLLCSDKNDQILKKKLNEDLKLIYVWLCANRLSLNVDKTEFIVFRPPRKTVSERFTLKLNGTVLFESTKIKYLGVILDPLLSWKHHIFELRKKLSRAVGILYKMKSCMCSKKILTSLYFAMFHSHMSYGILLYGLAGEKYTKKISLIQKRAIRIVSNASFNAHTKPLFSELKILNFFNTLKCKLAIFMWEYDHGLLPTCFNNYFKRVRETHEHNTRSNSHNKLSENILVKTDLHGKKMFRFIGPRVFNCIVELNFYKNCKTKQHFKNKIKDYLIGNDYCMW